MSKNLNWSGTIAFFSVVAAFVMVAAFAAAGSMPEPVIAAIRWGKLFHHLDLLI